MEFPDAERRPYDLRIMTEVRWRFSDAPGSARSPAAAPAAADWPQWGRTPQHAGAAPVAGQPLERILADVVYDPFVEA